MNNEVEASQVLNEYYNSLKTLTTCSSTVISRLTSVAKDKCIYYKAVIQAIEGQIRKVKPELKLPLIYLIDSIIKNEAELYPKGFSKNIRKIFIEAYRSVDPQIKEKLLVVLETWKNAKLFSSDVLSSISLDINNPQKDLMETNHNGNGKNTPPSNNIIRPISGGKRGLEYDNSIERGNPQSKFAGQSKQSHSNTPRPPTFQGQNRTQNYQSPTNRSSSGRAPYRPPSFKSNPIGQFPRPQPRYSGTRPNKRFERPMIPNSGVPRPHLNPPPPYAQQRPFFNGPENSNSFGPEHPNGDFGYQELDSNPNFYEGQALPPHMPEFSPHPRSFPPHQPAPVPYDHLPPPQGNFNPHLPKEMPHFNPQFQGHNEHIAPHFNAPQAPYAPPTQHMPNDYPPFSGPPQFVPATIENNRPYTTPYQEHTGFPPQPNAFSAPAPAPGPGSVSLDHGLLKSLLDSGVLSINSSQPPISNDVELNSVPLVSNTSNEVSDTYKFSLSNEQGTITATIVNLTQKDINTQHKGVEKVLYSDQTLQCKQCGIRYPESKESQEILSMHMDWHFRFNRNRKEKSGKKSYSRNWYSSELDWVEDQETKFDYSNEPVFFNQLSKPQNDAADSIAKLEMSVVVVPADHNGKPCPVCHDTFNTIWSDEEEDWIYKNAVLVGDEVLHATCHSDNNALSNNDTNKEESPEDNNKMNNLPHFKEEDITV